MFVVENGETCSSGSQKTPTTAANAPANAPANAIAITEDQKRSPDERGPARLYGDARVRCRVWDRTGFEGEGGGRQAAEAETSETAPSEISASTPRRITGPL